ncbi:hypothetical protein BABINDRAFT_165485 [Babjeviella inositovora NRRL Y-12698]|uniref:Mitochondrial group I intron splicing factor CCM1 n=1 Tax=Babjeviella inositovora NRRL Y-12698 TaxID=984486 RepID=A0A1E3QWG0_9ASCO|nr:uncharacterized protein BABINDRAFT_165485 [Babjeviella inositovora NRRL Y-12698]ODQ81980.1 hypothetical protein BABINDRAFT_165485 [Babjeviella inositovora NRRL Y-12698]
MWSSIQPIRHITNKTPPRLAVLLSRRLFQKAPECKAIARAETAPTFSIDLPFPSHSTSIKAVKTKVPGYSECPALGETCVDLALRGQFRELVLELTFNLQRHQCLQIRHLVHILSQLNELENFAAVAKLYSIHVPLFRLHAPPQAVKEQFMFAFYQLGALPQFEVVFQSYLAHKPISPHFLVDALLLYVKSGDVKLANELLHQFLTQDYPALPGDTLHLYLRSLMKANCTLSSVQDAFAIAHDSLQLNDETYAMMLEAYVRLGSLEEATLYREYLANKGLNRLLPVRMQEIIEQFIAEKRDSALLAVLNRRYLALIEEVRCLVPSKTNFDIHRFLNQAYLKLLRVNGAKNNFEDVEAVLAVVQNDPLFDSDQLHSTVAQCFAKVGDAESIHIYMDRLRSIGHVLRPEYVVLMYKALLNRYPYLGRQFSRDLMDRLHELPTKLQVAVSRNYRLALNRRGYYLKSGNDRLIREICLADPTDPSAKFRVTNPDEQVVQSLRAMVRSGVKPQFHHLWQILRHFLGRKSFDSALAVSQMMLECHYRTPIKVDLAWLKYNVSQPKERASAGKRVWEFVQVNRRRLNAQNVLELGVLCTAVRNYELSVQLVMGLDDELSSDETMLKFLVLFKAYMYQQNFQGLGELIAEFRGRDVVYKPFFNDELKKYVKYLKTMKVEHASVEELIGLVKEVQVELFNERFKAHKQAKEMLDLIVKWARPQA